MSTYFSVVDTVHGQKQYPNQHLDFSRALHAVVGYNINFKKDFRLKVEAYAQYLFSVPIGSDSAHSSYSIINYTDGFVNVPLTNKGSGYNYGLEITLEKFFSHHYFFMYTASLYQSKYRALDGVWRSTAYDVGYVMNLLAERNLYSAKRRTMYLVLT